MIEPQGKDLRLGINPETCILTLKLGLEIWFWVQIHGSVGSERLSTILIIAIYYVLAHLPLSRIIVLLTLPKAVNDMHYMIERQATKNVIFRERWMDSTSCD